MSDESILLDILKQTLEATRRVIKRFEPVDSVSFFTESDAGMEKLDAICMLLIAIGESLKKIDTITERSLLKKYPQIDWKGAKGMRDIISHHYFDIDAEEIYWVCEKQITELAYTIQLIITDVLNEDT